MAENETPFDAILQKLARVDFLTYQHSVSCGELMQSFAKTLGLDEPKSAEAGLLGLLHDAAKTEVNPQIFKKLQSGLNLSPDEKKQLRRKPEEVIDLVGAEYFPDGILEAFPQTGCRYDGKGEPNLKADSIHLYARMLKIVDYFDALTRQRTGKKRLSEDQSKQVLLKQKGRIFDPKLTDLFLEMMKAASD